MTEAEWLEETFPPRLLKYLRGKASDRKLRLFACEAFRVLVDAARRCFPAWVARLPEREDQRKAPEVAARFAEGQATAAELKAARDAAYAGYDTHRWLEYASWVTARPDAWQAAKDTDNALRSYISDELPLSERADAEPALVAAIKEDGGDHWQAALLRDVFGNPFRPARIDPAWLRWDDGTVPKIAQAIYDDRAFDRLPLLADALEDAGCDDAAILAHCRGPGPHVRGCWAVDLLLGKS